MINGSLTTKIGPMIRVHRPIKQWCAELEDDGVSPYGDDLLLEDEEGEIAQLVRMELPLCVLVGDNV